MYLHTMMVFSAWLTTFAREMMIVWQSADSPPPAHVCFFQLSSDSNSDSDSDSDSEVVQVVDGQQSDRIPIPIEKVQT
jgi:hypothetical protein